MDYHENGNIYKSGDFKNDQLNGTGKIFREDGELAREGKFENNKLNGEGINYFDNDNYKLIGWAKQVGLFSDNYIMKGQCFDVYNESLLFEGEFELVRHQDEIYFNYIKYGQVFSEYYADKILFDGEFYCTQEIHNIIKYGKWYLGNIIFEGHFILHEYRIVLHGRGKIYEKILDGSLILTSEGTYQNGGLTGKGKKYHTNTGLLEEEGNFYDAVLQGYGRKYTSIRDGIGIILVQEGFFENGYLREGKLYSSCTGLLEEEGKFQNYNKLHGIGKRYDYQGKLIQEGTFINGIFHGK